MRQNSSIKEDSMPKKVFVTGANGFTGSNLCRHLVERGDRVRAMVRPSSDIDALAGLDVELVRGDLAVDDGIPAEALRGVEIVYHIAALFRQEGATRNAFMNVNATGTERLLEAAMRAGVSRFVHCSTVGVHGHIEQPPATETAPYRPGDWYQESKLEGEKRAQAFGRAHDFPVAVIRPAGIYGAGDMRFLKLFRAIENGTFWMIGDGKPLYHFVYVDDLVQGIVLAGEQNAAVGEAFILSGPEYVTIGRLVELIARELGKPVPRWHIPIWPVMKAAEICKAVCPLLGLEPPLYPRRLDFFRKDRAFDCTKAKTVLGYEPEVRLPEGITKAAAWYREHHYLGQ
jgi:nucleoside-diphosphate-sugar epimerase